MTFQLILFDDVTARAWEPFALTRPVGELLFGVCTLRERAERALAASCVAHIGPEHLVGFEESGAPPVVAGTEGLDSSSDRLFLLSRFLPDWGAAETLRLREGAVATAQGDSIGWFAPAGASAPAEDFLLHPEGFAAEPTNRLPGSVLTRVWELISRNPDRITADVRALYDRPRRANLPEGVFVAGDHPLVLDSTATIEPCTFFDTSGGPILIEREARVRAFTRLAGPAYIGPGALVLGGSLTAVSIGPMSRIRGEFAESVCVGFVNKQHDGHIGHAYLGRWVNLGAETTNSDLKNNYGTIRLWTPDQGEVDTGEIKLGCLIGDHVKTGIGVLLTTGAVIGAGSNLWGSQIPPKFVPPFSWGTDSELTEFHLDKFLQVAERAMSRRNVEMTERMREQLGRAWKKGRETG